MPKHPPPARPLAAILASGSLAGGAAGAAQATDDRPPRAANATGELPARQRTR